MVRLLGAHGDQMIGTPSQRVGDEVVELADLVAADTDADQIVAFDPDIASDRRRESLKSMQWRRADSVSERLSLGESVEEPRGDHTITDWPPSTGIPVALT